jgi:RND family efflux transporter MFP subunit
LNKYALPLIVLSLAALLTTGCSAGKDDKTGKTERPAVAVETMSLSPSELTEGVDVTGSLAPKFETEVKSQIPGIIREVYVTEWVGVKKNAPLARIDVGETEAMAKRAEAAIESAKADLMQAEAAARRAVREKERTQKLVEFGLATGQSLQDAQTDEEAANARQASAAARIAATRGELSQLQARLSKGLMRSPMDGTVSLRDVNVGDFAGDVAAAKPLFKIVDNRIMKITVTVPSVEMAGIKTGDVLTFSVDTFPDETFSGKVKHINPSVDEADRSVKVTAEVLNALGQLKGGLFATGRIVTGVRKNVLQAPRSALVGFNVAAKKAALFVIKEGRAHYREVVTGAIAGDRVEIISGVAPSEEIVVRGAFNLKDADKVIATAAKAQIVIDGPDAAVQRR